MDEIAQQIVDIRLKLISKIIIETNYGVSQQGLSKIRQIEGVTECKQTFTNFLSFDILMDFSFLIPIQNLLEHPVE